MKLILANDQMQNIYVPLPFKVHLVFCIIATIVYALEIYRKKSLHYVFMMLAVDATLMMQFFNNSTAVVVLAVLESLLLGAAIVFAVLESKKRKAAAAAAAPIQAEGETDEDSDS
ncbi:MAG: hypothetical protein IJ172_12815 [Ruminococcus sp.]|nr:hypothetical protein [Ruminococcus sp.]